MRLTYEDSKGKHHLISDMNSQHLLNASAKLERKQDKNSDEIEVLAAMRAELKKREDVVHPDDLPRIDLSGIQPLPPPKSLRDDDEF